jgi:hypothetical protein
MTVCKLGYNIGDLLFVEDVVSWIKVDAWASAASKSKEIGEKSWNIGNMYQKDVLLLIALIDANNHLSPGSNLMSSSACKGDIGRLCIRCLDPVKVDWAADVDIGSTVNYPSASSCSQLIMRVKNWLDQLASPWASIAWMKAHCGCISFISSISSDWQSNVMQE